jgi:hypothetical protein
MTNADQMAELIELWSLIQDVQLGQSEDEIMWSWTANGAYSAKSAYKVQFRGSYCTYNCSAIWKAKAEGKHRVFAWLLIQNKILTADDLMIRNLPCNPICTLCDQAKETAGHLCLHCVYAREVWDHVSRWTNGLVSVPASFKGLDHRWDSCLRQIPKEQKRQAAASFTLPGTYGKKEIGALLIIGQHRQAGSWYDKGGDESQSFGLREQGGPFGVQLGSHVSFPRVA